MTPDHNLPAMDELELRISQLLRMQETALGTIEELRHLAADIAQVVAWLHAHAPDRFDARLSMGQLITGIFDEWLALRHNSLRRRFARILDSWVRKPKRSKEQGAYDDRENET